MHTKSAQAGQMHARVLCQLLLCKRLGAHVKLQVPAWVKLQLPDAATLLSAAMVQDDWQVRHEAPQVRNPLLQR